MAASQQEKGSEPNKTYQRSIAGDASREAGRERSEIELGERTGSRLPERLRTCAAILPIIFRGFRDSSDFLFSFSEDPPPEPCGEGFPGRPGSGGLWGDPARAIRAAAARFVASSSDSVVDTDPSSSDVTRGLTCDLPAVRTEFGDGERLRIPSRPRSFRPALALPKSRPFLCV